jgi:hypothetical protein
VCEGKRTQEGGKDVVCMGCKVGDNDKYSGGTLGKEGRVDGGTLVPWPSEECNYRLLQAMLPMIFQEF